MKMPEFYNITARILPEFYIIIARKIFVPDFFCGGGAHATPGAGALPPSPTPM